MHEVLGDALRVLAGSFEPQRKRSDGSESEPGLHRAEDASRERAPLLDLLTEFEVARGDVAEEDVAVSGHGLGVGGDGEIGPERERQLAERRRRGVVDGDERAGFMCGFTERSDVADLHGWGCWEFRSREDVRLRGDPAWALFAVGAMRRVTPILAKYSCASTRAA